MQLNHNYVGTEHLLLGLIRVSDGAAGEALTALGISLDDARCEVEAIIGRGAGPPSAHIPFTPRSKKVLELSLHEAMQLNQDWIGTEHILLGLIREGDGVAVQVLDRRGIHPDHLRQQVIQLLSNRPGGATPTGGSAFREAGNSTVARETEQATEGGEIRLLRAEIKRLRALLRAYNIDPALAIAVKSRP